MRTMRRTALITGITSQDGIILARTLLERGYHVIGFGRQTSIIARTELREWLPSIEIAYGDLADSVDIAEALQRHQPDEIYNLAAQSRPGLSWALALETGEATAMGAHRVFEAARRFSPRARIYQASSSEMFGAADHSPQDEGTPFRPTNPYAVAKVYAHQMAQIYRRTYGMFIACGILFNHESIYRAPQFLTQKITYGAACAKLGISRSEDVDERGHPLVMGGRLHLGNLDAARDWGCAIDYVDAMHRMLQCDIPGDFVIGTGRLRKVSDLCEIAYRHVGVDWRDHVSSDPGLVRMSETGPTVANASKAHRELGWSPVTPLEDVLEQMVELHVNRLARRVHPGFAESGHDPR